MELATRIVWPYKPIFTKFTIIDLSTLKKIESITKLYIHTQWRIQGLILGGAKVQKVHKLNKHRVKQKETTARPL